jgi:putative PEP-CTERM system TPR-repeat lipoprotein
MLLCLTGCRDAEAPSAEQAVAGAEQFVQHGRHAQAAHLLLQAVRGDPGNAMLRWHLGRIYLLGGATDVAASHLNAALDAGMSASSVLPLLAKAHLIGEDLDRLFGIEFDAALSADARAAVLATQARGHILQQRFDLAEILLREAASASDETAAVGVARAHLLLAQGDMDQAEAELRALIARYPNSGDALAMLGDVVRDQGDLREAERLYGLALEHSEVKFHLHFLRAEVRLDLGLVEGAEEDAAALESGFPGTFAALYTRARLLLTAGEATEALAKFEAANEQELLHPGTLLYGGVAAYAAGRINLAEDWLTRVIKEMPDNLQARLVLGAMRFDQRRYAEAERLLQPLPQAIPGNPVPRRLLAASLVAQDKAAQAVPLLTELVRGTPDDPRAQLDLSVALVLSGAEQRGVSGLDGLVARHPEYGPAYEYLVAYHVRERDWATAESWADRFIEAYSDRIEPLVFKGEVLFEAGRLDAAHAAFEQVLAVEPAHPQANLRLAAMAVATGDRAQAEARYARVLEQHPEHLDTLLAKSRLATEADRGDEAQALLETAVAAHPGSLNARMSLARLSLTRGEGQNAVEALLDDADADFARDAAYMRMLVESHLAAGAPRLAADAARQLVALEPSSLDAYGLYAEILTRLDDKVALEETLKQMLTIDPEHVPTRLELARLQIATERYEVAERLLTPVLEDLDRPPLADFLYGLILTATDRAGQAVGPLKHAHRELPSERTLLALANAEAQSGRVEDAIGRTAEWLDAHPDDVEVRVTRAGHLVQAERVTEAIAEYERALALAPNHAVALNNLAWYALAQDPRRAMEYAQRALEVKPDSVEVAHTLVSAQVEAGEWRDAELTLDRVLPLHPTDTGLMWLSARVLHQKGRAEEALRRLERILNADPPDAERERARALLVQIEDEIRAEEAKKLW